MRLLASSPATLAPGLISVLAIITSGLFAWLSHLRMKMVETYLAEIVAWLDEGEDPPPDDGEELPENVLKLRRSI